MNIVEIASARSAYVLACVMLTMPCIIHGSSCPPECPRRVELERKRDEAAKKLGMTTL